MIAFVISGGGTVGQTHFTPFYAENRVDYFTQQSRRCNAVVLVFQ